MAIYFISDIHLNPARPDVYEDFSSYLRRIAHDADELYILGDLFDYWIGDDGIDLLGHQTAVERLRETSLGGTKIFVMHGNRDFLIGQRFLDQFSGVLLTEPHVIELGGQPVLLMHGDSLCTDDVEHQNYRKTVLSPQWQKAVLELPLQERLNRALSMRQQSKSNRVDKSHELMDVNQDAVRKTMLEYEVRTLIHGHVHKPGIHEFEIDNLVYRRYVLGDWGGKSEGVIKVDPNNGITFSYSIDMNRTTA